MKNRIVLAIVLSLGLLVSAAMAADATKVAIANPAKIFNDMQELKDLRAKMDSEKRLLDGVSREKEEKIKALQAARDALKSDTPQYQDKNSEYLKAAIEYKTWGELNQMNFQREQKLQLKAVYQKIETAIAEISKQKGYDLVIVDQRTDLPEDIDRLNIEQLRALINSRTVLYSSDKIDISADVLAMLDAKYRGATTKPQP